MTDIDTMQPGLNPSLVRPLIVVAVIALLGLPVSVRALTVNGQLTQGGLAIGNTAPGATVNFQGRPIQVSPAGLFVIGFDRDAGPEATIEIRSRSGRIETHALTIARRTYPIQRIEGLPQGKVTPATADLSRIREEIALVNAVRLKDDPRQDFTQRFIWPVVGRISGVYGSQRILNGTPKRPHYGVDIAAPTGTPVRAPADGVVTLVHDDMFYSGGTLIVDHGHGITTSYLHLHQILVKTGQTVRQGQVIAQVGATGRVTGPHLHWGMNWFDTRLDPSLMVPPMPADSSFKSTP
jgi:murein DD-endopeptidase MepM/ murein hydrolase activator NlpD